MTDTKIYSTTTVTPKQIPVKCPVCNGFGTLRYGSVVCHGCQGKGYVLVDVKNKEEEK